MPQRPAIPRRGAPGSSGLTDEPLLGPAQLATPAPAAAGSRALAAAPAELAGAIGHRRGCEAATGQIGPSYSPAMFADGDFDVDSFIMQLTEGLWEKQQRLSYVRRTLAIERQTALEALQLQGMFENAVPVRELA